MFMCPPKFAILQLRVSIEDGWPLELNTFSPLPRKSKAVHPYFMSHHINIILKNTAVD